MKIFKSLLGISLLALSAWTTASPLAAGNGKFTLNGAPFYGVGVNYMDAFTRYVNTGKDVTWMTGLATLKAYNVPFIRVNAIGFWPVDIQANYVNNKATFYARLDTFMNEAAKQKVGVILDIFWNWTAFSDLNNEHVPAWGNTNSATRKMMRATTTEMVTRYKNHPALWGWEFANETTSMMDVPDNINNYKWLPNYTGAPARTRADNFNSAMILDAMTDFARTVRTIDPSTPIFSGNDHPRYTAYHLPKSWDQDTPDQFGQILSRDNARTDTTSIHLYPYSEMPAFGADPTTKTALPGTVPNILATAAKRARLVDANGKLVDPRPLFLGEFGTSDKDLGPTVAKTKFLQIADAIISNRIPMSALWVFDMKAQDGTYNVTASNSRAYQLDKIKQMNATMKTWK
jgi:hypothetical protein